MSQTERPTLILICKNCHADMPRAMARGLLIGNRTVTVQSGFTQECVACGHLHPAGTRISYTMRGAA